MRSLDPALRGELRFLHPRTRAPTMVVDSMLPRQLWPTETGVGGRLSGCHLRRILSTWDEVLHPRQTGLGSSARLRPPPTHSSISCSPPSGGPGKVWPMRQAKADNKQQKSKWRYEWSQSIAEDGQCYSSANRLLWELLLCVCFCFVTCHLKNLSPIFQPLKMTVCGWATHLCTYFLSWIGRAFRQLCFHRDPFF